MVMMLAMKFMLKTPNAISEINLSCQTGITYCSHCSMDSSESDLRILFFDSIVKIVNGWMVPCFYEGCQDLLSLLAAKQTLFFQVLPEDGFR